MNLIDQLILIYSIEFIVEFLIFYIYYRYFDNDSADVAVVALVGVATGAVALVGVTADVAVVALVGVTVALAAGVAVVAGVVAGNCNIQTNKSKGGTTHGLPKRTRNTN